MFFLLFIACGPFEYTIEGKIKDSQGGDPPESTTETAAGGDGPFGTTDVSKVVDVMRDVLVGDSVNMRFDAAIQRMGWGQELMRCQLQLTFSRRAYGPQEHHGNPPPANPTEAGTCAFTSYDSMPQQHDDNWFISGELIGPDEVYLYGLSEDYTLELVVAEDGLLRYDILRRSFHKDVNTTGFEINEVEGVALH